MADDVSSFFKSKKSKKHGVVKQTPDKLAKKLEKTVQQQQVFDRENGVEENEEEVEQQRERPSYVKQFSGGGGGGGGGAGGEQQNNDESEWLDYQDQQEVDLAKIGIKEMELREESEDEANEDEETLTNRKTWNVPGQEQKQPQKGKKVTYAAGMDVDDGEEGTNADEKPETTTKANENEKPQQEESEASKSEADKEEGEKKTVSAYVPPSLRRNQLVAASRPTGNTKQPNIEDSMEFPSLAAAGELAAEIEKTKKKKPPQYQAMKKSAAPAPAHAHSPSPAPAEETQSSRPQQPEPVHAAPEAASEPTKPAYVPPHLRKRGGAS